ncbi:caltractin [Biomphalaria pfeifferi]|uniref:Caltractin n=1 Tax=Biomphalaria pfeifferi TaxID=112525 RepID=A0AAD8FA96_BIOPF|nr:caltractin [Biomphalaria pfeifferi]
MPGKKKSKKAGGKKKSKKGGKAGKKSSKSILKESKSSSVANQFDNRPPLLRPGEKLVDLLKTHPVDEKEVNGIKVSSRVLEQLTAQDIRDLHVVFEIFDTNSDGIIGSADLRQALRTLGFKVKKDEANRIAHDGNVKAKNEIDFNEFLEIIIDKQSDTRDVYEDILKGFKMFDFDDAGSISIEKLKRACNLVGIKFTQKELEEMLEEADLNGDGKVDQTEFIQIMLQTNLF